MLLLSTFILSSIYSSQPVQTWEFNTDTIQDGTFAEAQFGGGLIFNSAKDLIQISSKEKLPRIEFTISAWVSIEEPLRWGGIIGCVQDNNDVEYGWVLGYNQSQFTFGLSTEGANDGDGRMTYLDSATLSYEVGNWHHVVATYDGRELKLYVDGTLSNTTNEQSGAILYNDESPFVIGAYLDDNESHPFDGRLLEVSMDHTAASASEILDAFNKNKTLLNVI